MKAPAKPTRKPFGATFKTIDLTPQLNWPGRAKDEWWRKLAEHVRGYPQGEQRPWGIAFRMAEGGGRLVILDSRRRPEVTVKVGATGDFACVLHEWRQLPQDVSREDPHEGLVVA